MSRHRARIKQAEQQLQAGSPSKIIVIWPGDPEPPPEEPGENRIEIRVVYQDSPLMEL